MKLDAKYRPAGLEDVIGQEAAVKILSNMVKTGNSFPVLVFYGDRGSGKTSCARIYSKSLNCEHLSPMGSPCGVCEACKNPDLFYQEIDSASRGSVDSVREVISSSRYHIMGGKTHVILFDEAHLLSSQAWDALLKTLEEPPAGVVFILVTTEWDKVPLTIRSRAFSIPFFKVDPVVIKERLALICKKENIDYEDEVLDWVAQVGGVRDGVVTLEQLSTMGKITKEVAESLGMVSFSYFDALMECIKVKDVASFSDGFLGKFNIIGVSLLSSFDKYLTQRTLEIAQGKSIPFTIPLLAKVSLAINHAYGKENVFVFLIDRLFSEVGVQSGNGEASPTLPTSPTQSSPASVLNDI